MFTFSIQARKDQKNKNGYHTIQLIVTKNRKVKRTNLGQYVKEEEWNFIKNTPTGRHPNKKKLTHFIASELSRANDLAMDLSIKRIDLSLNDFIDKFMGRTSSGVISFIDKLISDMIKNKKFGNAEKYKTVRNTLGVALGDEITFAMLNYSALIEYENHLRENGSNDGGVNVNMRTLRAIYNKAIDFELSELNDYPFRRYKIVKTTVKKRAKDIETIKRFINFDYPDKYEKTLDVIKFSILNQSINFVDIAHLKKDNIVKGRLEYYRKKVTKTPVFFSIKLLPASIELLKKYDYDFFSISGDYKTYRLALKRQSDLIAEMCNLCGVKLTFYDFRHSYSTIARNELGIDRDVISQLLGHKQQDITETYLGAYDNYIVDEANEKISSFILG
jgi:integrase